MSGRPGWRAGQDRLGGVGNRPDGADVEISIARDAGCAVGKHGVAGKFNVGISVHARGNIDLSAACDGRGVEDHGPTRAPPTAATASTAVAARGARTAIAAMSATSAAATATATASNIGEVIAIKTPT